jgi:pyruvate,water dikinase
MSEEEVWTDVLRPLADVGRRPRDGERRTGDKARKLAILAHAGVPVPVTWVLEAQHYQAFVDKVLPRKHDLRTLIKLNGTKAGDERCARAYQELLAAPLDERIARGVEGLWEAHGGELPLGIAVRASLAASGAGAAGSHLHSRIGLDDVASILDAIREVWASSVLSHAVAAYAGADVRDLSVALVLQEVVRTELAGIITRTTGSSDPVAGADWHLGALVDAANHHWARRATVLAPLSQGRGAPHAPDGIEALRAHLEPGGFEKLLEAGALAEREIGKSAVVHFAVESGGRVHVLAADEHPRWALLGGGDEATGWVTIGLGMRGLEPTTRFTQSVVERLVHDALGATLAHLRCEPEQPLLASRDGRSYLNLGALAAAVVDVPLATPADVLAAVGGAPPTRIREIGARHYDRGSLWRSPLIGGTAMREQLGLERECADLVRGIERDARGLGDMDVTLLPGDAVSTTLTSAQTLLERAASLWCRFAAAQLGCQLTVRALVRRRFPDAPDRAVVALTSGVGGLFFPSMAPAFARLVRAVYEEPNVAAQVRSAPETVKRPSDLPDGRSRGALGQFLARYGDLAFGAFELGLPRWREDASELVRMIGLAVAVGPEPFERAQHEARARALADAELLRYEPELSGFERRALRHLVERYRRLSHERASVERLLLRVLRLLREVALDVDRRLRRYEPAIPEGGAFQCSLQRLAGALKSGRPELGRIIRMRLVEREAESREPAPPLAFAGSPPRGAIPLVPSASLSGIGVSPGVVEGRVRIVHGVLPSAIEPGDVLVVPAFDPALTPLCGIAGAVIAELGGVLSVGAELARELALPCVMGVTDAALRLRDGERVRVDGERGTVLRMELALDAAAQPLPLTQAHAT